MTEMAKFGNQTAFSVNQSGMHQGYAQQARNGKGNPSPKSWQSSQNHIWAQLSKTKMCKYKLQGTCTKGKQCNFAHDETEMSNLPDLSCTKLCATYIQIGKCDKPGCTYAHSKDELRATSDFHKTKLCRFWPMGSCELGNKCRFAHTQTELRPAFDSPINEPVSIPPPPQQQRPQGNPNQVSRVELGDHKDMSLQQNSRLGKGQGKKRQGTGNNGFRRNHDESEGMAPAEMRFQNQRRREDLQSGEFSHHGEGHAQQVDMGSDTMYPNHWNMQEKDHQNYSGFVGYGDMAGANMAGAVWIVPAPVGVDGTSISPAAMPYPNGEVMQGTLVVPDMGMQGYQGGWDLPMGQVQVPSDWSPEEQALANCSWQVGSSGADSGGTPGTCTPTSAIWSSQYANTPGSSDSSEQQDLAYQRAWQVKNTFLSINAPQPMTLRQVRSANDMLALNDNNGFDPSD